MQLHDLKHHPVAKFFGYIAFALIIISFVFFYGWNSAAKANRAQDTSFARYQSDNALNFLPWRKWDYINSDEVKIAQEAANSRKLNQLPQQLLQMLGRSGSLPQWATIEEAVQYAMDERLLRREAARLGIVVTREDMIEVLKKQYGSNPAMLDNVLRAQGLDMESYIEKLREEQEANRARNFIASQARVSLFELWQEYLVAKEKITLKVAAYPIESYLDKVQVSDQEMQEYLDKNIESYRIPAKRRYAYVKVTREELRKTVEATEDQIKAHYEQNQTAFKQNEAVKVEELFAPVSADQTTTAALGLILKAHDAATTTGTWSAVADKLQAENQGSSLYYRAQDWIERTDEAKRMYGPTYVDRIFTIADDAISTPVQGPDGFHVVRRIGRRAEGVPALEAIHDKVADHYKDTKAEEMFKEKFNALREEVHKYNTLRDFASQVGLQDGLTTEVTATEMMIPEIGALHEHSNYIHGLKINQLSELIPVPLKSPDTFCALEIVQEKESYLPKLEEVRNAVETEVKKTKATETAQKAAEAARDAVKGNSDFEAAVANAPKPPIESKPFTRLDPVDVLGSPLIGFGKESRQIAVNSIGISKYGADDKSSEGFALWKVEAIEQPPKDEFKKERRSFEADYLRILGYTLVEEWLADKRKEAGYDVMYKSGKK